MHILCIFFNRFGSVLSDEAKKAPSTEELTRRHIRSQGAFLLPDTPITAETSLSPSSIEQGKALALPCIPIEHGVSRPCTRDQSFAD